MIENGTLVYEEERKVLDWFSHFLNNASVSFQTSTYCFKNYYEKCINDLVKLPYSSEKKSEIAEGKLTAIYAEDLNDFKENCGYNRILERMKKDVRFLEEVTTRGIISEEFAQAIAVLPVEKLGKMTKEEVALLMSDSNRYVESVYDDSTDKLIREKKVSGEAVDESLVPLLKAHRLNNLQVKYAHTARIVYLTDLEVKKLGVDDEVVRSILYTAALFHDVGRFYQGTYYNSYAEGELKKTENNSVKDHAEAGYYYSLLDMINLNVLGAATNEDLIIHSIAAAVVKKHQLPNAALGNYDRMISDFKFNDNVKQEMLDFVLNCYGVAEKFDGGLHGRFQKTAPGNAEAMRQSFTDSMLNVISAYTGEENLESIRNTVYSLFSYESPSLVLNEENINILRQKLNGESLEELNQKLANKEVILLSPEYNKVIKDHKLGSLLENDDKSSLLVKDFMEKLIASTDMSDYYAQYDIVGTIDKVMEADSKGEDYRGIRLNDDIAKVLRMSMGLVMDMDKLDILVQRAIKRYPDWKPDAIRVKALKAGEEANLGQDESLLDVLEKEFQIDVKSNETGKVILDDVLVDVIKHSVNVNDTFKKKFGENYDFSNIKAGMVADDVIDKALKASFEGKTVSMPYDIMEKAHPDLNERYKIEMDLILPPDLRENVFKKDEDREYKAGVNGAVTAFPLGNKASEDKHFQWANAFPGVWWQLDQFVMTNMRSMESLRFIKDTGLLERIGKAYKSGDCPKEFGMFVDEVINFSSSFIDLALTAKTNDKGDMLFGETNQEGYSPVILSDKDTMLKIRNEAAIRYQDMKKQEAVIEAEHNSQLDSMFSTSVSTNSREQISGNDLSSMFVENNATINSGAMVSESGKK